MGSHITTGIRWREDTGWEFRCGECATDFEARFWPLTDEFWDKSRGMLRCRACWRQRDRAASRKRYSNEELRARKVANGRRYRAENKRIQHLKDAAAWEATKADPVLLDKARERGREGQRRYRARHAEARAA